MPSFSNKTSIYDNTYTFLIFLFDIVTIFTCKYNFNTLVSVKRFMHRIPNAIIKFIRYLIINTFCIYNFLYKENIIQETTFF